MLLAENCRKRNKLVLCCIKYPDKKADMLLLLVSEDSITFLKGQT